MTQCRSSTQPAVWVAIDQEPGNLYSGLLLIRGGLPSKVETERVVAVGRDDAIDRRARAEQAGGDLRREATRRTKQDDVKSQQVAVAGLTKLRKQLILLGLRNVE